jgi:hypothetical protein
MNPLFFIICIVVLITGTKLNATDLLQHLTPGELVGQALPDGATWTGDRDWLEVVEEADGKKVLRSDSSKSSEWQRVSLALPEGSAEEGVLCVKFEVQIVETDDATSFGITVGRDAEGESRGRALRMVLRGNGEVRVVGNAGEKSDTVRDLLIGGEWIPFVAKVDYESKQVTLQAQEEEIVSQEFITESEGGVDHRGTLEISSGSSTAGALWIRGLEITDCQDSSPLTPSP